MDLTEQMRAQFQNDRFAMRTGCVIEEARSGYARCGMELTGEHRNAAGAVMGGAVFTLADFCFSVAANTGQPLTVSLTGQISFLSATKGNRLIAEASCTRAGHTVCFFEVLVTDDLGEHVATASFSGYRRG